MFVALTRGISPTITDCQLEYLPRLAIDAVKAARQHREYEICLLTCGLQVISLPPDPEFPDGLFVEDPAIVLDELAVMCRPGTDSRRREVASLAEALLPFRTIEWIREPATLEGGDVLRIGRKLFCGISRRTSPEGARQLQDLTAKFGYSVIPVPVAGCLHLKSAICALSDDSVLANRRWIGIETFRDFRVIDVPEEEPSAANVLRIGEKILMPASFPRTRQLLGSLGFEIVTLDISELQKAEAGVTCSSLIFEA